MGLKDSTKKYLAGAVLDVFNTYVETYPEDRKELNDILSIIHGKFEALRLLQDLERRIDGQRDGVHNT